MGTERCPEDSPWDVAHYSRKRRPRTPIAIPSLGREALLVTQTLATLRRVAWPEASIFVFVDGAARRPDGARELSVYRRALFEAGFPKVHVLAGGGTLREQYKKIFSHFRGKRVVLMSDTVPGFRWRRHTHNVTTVALSPEMFKVFMLLGFDVAASLGFKAWGFCPCKCPINLHAGRFSRKCGLLDGNFFGLDLTEKPAPAITVSDYTTDVELSLRLWSRDGGFARFTGVTAEHAYRQRGGHSLNLAANARVKATAKAIKALAVEFPTLLVATTLGGRSEASMPYKFRPLGPAPVWVRGSFTSRGRRPVKGTRKVPGRLRMAACRRRARKRAVATVRHP